MSRIVCIIPARGGSKGIPKKNLYPVAGKPLIAWTIESALQSKKISRVIVSTDNEEIADVARTFGAEVPFMRPAELAEDLTPDLPVFQHALSELEKEGKHPEIIVQLWATSPFRNAADIDEAIALLEANAEADSVRSVTSPSQTPFKMWRRDQGDYLAPILLREYPESFDGREPHTLPRQNLPETLVQTGYLNVVRAPVVVSGSMQGKRILPFFHPSETYTEFDSLKDVSHTEYVLKQKQ